MAETKQQPQPVPFITCQECGGTDRATFTPDVNRDMEELGVCFSCLYWTRMNPRDPRLVRVDGVQYSIADEDARGFRGFGGSFFRIRFHDGKTVETTNLWFNGPIPEHFKDRLPDNAEFVWKFQTPQHGKENTDD